MAELQVLLSEEIPNGRKSLTESHNNLQKVASYCVQKYADEADKKAALEETKKYTTQSLASVAYQINTLATNMLKMMDIQTAQLSNMDSAINNIAQTVEIHKEKVARREIGLLTTSKVVTRSHQIVAPSNPERPVKYVRKPVDYTELDDIGHGVKLNAQPNTGTARKTVSAKKSPASSTDGGSKRDSLKSTTSGFGTLRPVKAPTVPPEFSQSSSEVPPPPPMAGGLPPPPPPNVGPSLFPPPDVGPPPPPPPVAPVVDGLPMPPSDFPPPCPISLPPGTISSQIPPPPPPAPTNSSTPDSRGGYSTPVVDLDGKAPPGGDSGGTYSTSVMDLPPPPPSNTLSSHNPPFGASTRNPILPMSGFTARVTGADMGIPPPPLSGGDILPPPPPLMGAGSPTSMDGISMEPDWAPKTYLEKMVIIYDYSAENADELNLKEDQVVYVVKKNDDGWYEGVADGRTGLFPGNYAEPVSS